MYITEFFENEFKDFSLYSSFRGLANYVDGLKPSSRKLLFTVDKRGITQNIKTANLASSASEMTSYIHGAVSLEGAAVLLAQEFSNNCNLLSPEGNFGNKLNHEASASRYIFTKKSEWFDLILHPDDRAILNYRIFEGAKIEPYYYVPVVPLILVNGSTGIGSGYAQTILPRRLDSVIDAIEKLLDEKKVKAIPPSLESFHGDVVLTEGNKVEIRGTIAVGDAKITVTELPFSYDLDSYKEKLAALEERGDIKSFKDLSENGKFLFEIKCTREFCSLPKDELLKKLALVDKVSENFSCVSEKDSIVVFKDEVDLLKKFMKIRLKTYDLRKEYLLQAWALDALELKNKVKFLKDVMADKLVVYKRSKKDLEADLVAMKYDRVSDSYDYLLSMRVDSFTTEKFKKLEEELAAKKAQIEVLKGKDAKALWVEDLKRLKIAKSN